MGKTKKIIWKLDLDNVLEKHNMKPLRKLKKKSFQIFKNKFLNSIKSRKNETFLMNISKLSYITCSWKKNYKMVSCFSSMVSHLHDFKIWWFSKKYEAKLFEERVGC